MEAPCEGAAAQQLGGLGLVLHELAQRGGDLVDQLPGLLAVERRMAGDVREGEVLLHREAAERGVSLEQRLHRRVNLVVKRVHVHLPSLMCLSSCAWRARGAMTDCRR